MGRARQDREIAEAMQLFGHSVVENYQERRIGFEPSSLYVFRASQELIRAHPGLEHRYFHPATRYFDAILFLLSPERRWSDSHQPTDKSLIAKAIHGCEPLCPGSKASQGNPMNFVPASDVAVIADYLDSVTYEQLQKECDYEWMMECYVYKIYGPISEEQFGWIWEEFTGMRDLYRAAADHNEAVITYID